MNWHLPNPAQPPRHYLHNQRQHPRIPQVHKLPSPTNVTISNQPISKPQLSNNVGINYDTLIYGAGAIVLLIVVSALALTLQTKKNASKYSRHKQKISKTAGNFREILIGLSEN